MKSINNFIEFPPSCFHEFDDLINIENLLLLKHESTYVQIYKKIIYFEKLNVSVVCNVREKNLSQLCIN
jgi:hypothetical protein